MRRFAFMFAFLAFVSAAPAMSASLQVAPVLIDVPAPGAASTVTLRNIGARPITAQIRVFRWTQAPDGERLEPTVDVVASPPMTELRPRQDYTVRLVRATARPVVGEESYRVVIDELPEPAQKSGTVALVMRHVLPLFFHAPDATPADAVWTVRQLRGSIVLSAANRGGRRLRLAAVDVRDATGRSVSFSRGLLGYALGGSSMRWAAPVTTPRFRPGEKVTIIGLTEVGPFHAQSTVQTVP